MDCYSKMGDFEKTLKLFYILKENNNIQIDDTMYCIVINACSHCGLIKQAINIFNHQISIYYISNH